MCGFCQGFSGIFTLLLFSRYAKLDKERIASPSIEALEKRRKRAPTRPRIGQERERADTVFPRYSGWAKHRNLVSRRYFRMPVTRLRLVSF